MPGNKKEYRKKWPDPIQIQLSGSGGQGLILAGIILAVGAIRDGHHVAQTQAYGPEARGGASRAEVILGSDPIDYPHLEKPDIILALTQEACDKYVPSASPGALVIVDSLLVQTVPETRADILRIPVAQTAKQDLGREMVANIVALGALNEVAQLVTWPSLEAAVLEMVPPGTSDLNTRALTAGKKLAAALRAGIQNPESRIQNT